MDFAERLAKERRARLAAERRLEQTTRELMQANEKLSRHALSLSDQIVEQRAVVHSALNEKAQLQGLQTRFEEDLAKANNSASLAEQRLLDSIHSLDEGFAVFDVETRLVTANETFLGLIGISKAAFGQPYVDLFGQAILQGRITGTEGPLPASWAFDTLAQVDGATGAEVRLNDGRWLRVINRSASTSDLVTHLQDITPEKRIWAAIEAIPDGFVLFDRDDRLLIANQRYREVFPLCAPAMVPGATFEEILRYGVNQGEIPEALGREDDWVHERLAARATNFAICLDELEDGRVIRSKDTPLPDGGRVGFRFDVTDELAQEKALVQARHDAESASRAKAAFLASMSHEIRTPISGMVAMAELLRGTVLNDEQVLFSDTIRSSGAALLNIINDILEYSKIDSGDFVLQSQCFDLERLVHEIVVMMQPAAHSKGLKFLVDFDFGIPTLFMGDAGRIRQVLTNLIGNAVKFTMQGEVSITIVGIVAEDGQVELRIMVTDTGIGIAPDALSLIFTEFSQSETAMNRRFDGAGLGLAIARGLVMQMGGEVWVDSVLGEGSTFGFSLILPVAEPDFAQPGRLGLKHVVMLDLDLTTRFIFETRLALFGTHVTLCNGPDDYRAVLDSTPVDLVLYGPQIAQPDLKGDDLWAVRVTDDRPGETPFVLQDGRVTAITASLARARFLQLLMGPVTVPVEPAEVPNRQMRVLAAEDNRTNQLVLQKMLRDLDIDLLFANNGLEAVSLYQSFCPDLIFMDISMPEMDGKDATRAIRALEATGQYYSSHIPVVALTAHAMVGDDTDILAAGIDRYMTKPLRRAELLDIVIACQPAQTRNLMTAVNQTADG